LVPFLVLAAAAAQEMAQERVMQNLGIAVVLVVVLVVPVVLVVQVFRVKETTAEIRVLTSAPVVVVPVRWEATVRPVSVVLVAQV